MTLPWIIDINSLFYWRSIFFIRGYWPVSFMLALCFVACHTDHIEDREQISNHLCIQMNSSERFTIYFTLYRLFHYANGSQFLQVIAKEIFRQTKESGSVRIWKYIRPQETAAFPRYILLPLWLRMSSCCLFSSEFQIKLNSHAGIERKESESWLIYWQKSMQNIN